MVCDISFDILGIQLQQDSIQTSILGNGITPEHDLVLDVVQTDIFGITATEYEFPIWRDINRVKMLVLGRIL